MKKAVIIITLFIILLFGCKKISDIVYKIDQDACISCGECVNKCPHNAIIYDGAKPVIIQSKCKSCGKCVTACPENAIH